MKNNLQTNNRLSEAHLSLGIVDQVKRACQKQNRVAMILGCILGGFIPVATYTTAHCEVDPSLALWFQLPALMVLGGLVYSAITVYGWAKVAFKNPLKAVGFVVLLEGTMTFSHSGLMGVPILSLAALSLLVGINAVAAGTMLVLDQKKARK